MIPLSGIAPVTDAAEAADIVTHLENGGGFYLPPEATALLISAALLCAAAAIFFVSYTQDKKGQNK